MNHALCVLNLMSKQEGISVECQPSVLPRIRTTQWARLNMLGGETAGSDQGQGVVLFSREGGKDPVWWRPCEQTEWQTHTTENMTFSQICWREETIIGSHVSSFYFYRDDLKWHWSLCFTIISQSNNRLWLLRSHLLLVATSGFQVLILSIICVIGFLGGDAEDSSVHHCFVWVANNDFAIPQLK